MHHFLIFKVNVKKSEAILIPETFYIDCVFLLLTLLETSKIFFFSLNVLKFHSDIYYLFLSIVLATWIGP